MGLMNKVSAAFRGATREAIQGVVDSNSWRILEQEIFEYERSLTQARKDLTRLVAERLRVEREFDALSHSIREGEEGVAEALAEDQDARAEELALWVVEKEQQAAALKQSVDMLCAEEQALTRQLRESIHQLQGYQRELRLARTRQHSQEASRGVTGTVDSLSGDEVRSSLDRIGHRQQRLDELLKARQQVTDSLKSSFDKHREEASQRSKDESVAAVMARVKQRERGGQ